MTSVSFNMPRCLRSLMSAAQVWSVFLQFFFKDLHKPHAAFEQATAKYRYYDDQETPDTHVVTFDFGGQSITWEGRSWSKRGFEGSMFGVAFYGEKGSIAIDGSNYTVYDANEKR